MVNGSESFTSLFARTITPLLFVKHFSRTFLFTCMNLNSLTLTYFLLKLGTSRFISGVTVLTNCDVKLSFRWPSFDQLNKQITCRWISCNERIYIRVTYIFLVKEIFGLRRGFTIFPGRYIPMWYFKKNSLVVPLSWQTKLATSLFLYTV